MPDDDERGPARVPVTMKLLPDLLRVLDEAAAEDHRSRTNYLEEMLRELAEKRKANHEHP